jgi:hypothetical protein
MAAHAKPPLRTWCDGTGQFTIVEAHPYHRPVAGTDHKSPGEHERASDKHCLLRRAEASPKTCPACGSVLEVLLFLGVQPDGYVCPTCQIH